MRINPPHQALLDLDPESGVVAGFAEGLAQQSHSVTDVLSEVPEPSLPGQEAGSLRPGLRLFDQVRHRRGCAVGLAGLEPIAGLDGRTSAAVRLVADGGQPNGLGHQVGRR